MAKLWSGPQQLDWEVYAGDLNRELFAVQTTDPVDLTGAVIEAQARKSAVDKDIALTAKVTPVELTLGQFTVEWSGTEVRALLAGEMNWSGVWDLQITMADETLPMTLLRGQFVATHDVTRAAGAP